MQRNALALLATMVLMPGCLAETETDPEEADEPGLEATAQDCPEGEKEGGFEAIICSPVAD